ncbi:MAG TPA: hypothetical protein VGZ47_01180, partial [Gemmataceae bacterium]|nr:hypothetical protein [Gemmataceae bacterium]
MIEDKDRYSAIVQLVVVSETTSWNRFYIFLVFASILILAWTTIYSQSSPPKCATIIMASMSAVGFIAGLAWAGLGWRGRTFVNKFVELGRQLEGSAEAQAQQQAAAQHQQQAVNPLTEAEAARDSFSFGHVGSYYLLIGGPLVCCVLF